MWLDRTYIHLSSPVTWKNSYNLASFNNCKSAESAFLDYNSAESAFLDHSLLESAIGSVVMPT